MTTIIGKQIAVVHADNPSCIGIQGKAVDETRHLIILNTHQGEKKVQKKSVTISFDGNELRGGQLFGTIVEQMKR